MQLPNLTPNPDNPRVITSAEFERLKDKLRRVPVGLLANRIVHKDGIVKAGNQRYRALQELVKEGFEIKPDYFVDATGWTDEQVEEFLITSNISDGDCDYEILANRWDPELLGKWGLEIPELSIEAREDDVPELETEADPISKEGEIYQLGEHRLMCGSSTNPDDVRKLMDGEKAHMVFTDPPYNVDYTGGMGTHAKNERSGILNDKMEKGEFYQFLSDAIRNMIDYCNGGIYICMSSSELDTLKIAFEEQGGHWQSFVIWVKNNFTLSRSDYQHIYEPMLYGWPDGVTNHYFIQNRDIPNVWEDLREIKTNYDGNETTIKFHGFEVKIRGKVEGEVRRKKQRTDIWRYDKPTKSEEHPTMKPVRLCAEAIRNSSKKGQLVLDLFGGSGSTLIAAEQLHRKCNMMELDPKYVDVIRKRYWKFVNDDDETGWEENTPKESK